MGRKRNSSVSSSSRNDGILPSVTELLTSSDMDEYAFLAARTSSSRNGDVVPSVAELVTSSDMVECPFLAARTGASNGNIKTAIPCHRNSGALSQNRTDCSCIETRSFFSGDISPLDGQAMFEESTYLWGNYLEEGTSFKPFDVLLEPSTKVHSSQQSVRPLNAIIHVLYVFIPATIVFNGSYFVSSLFGDRFLSALWFPTGLCMLWLLIWNKHWENMISILAAYIVGCSFRIGFVSDVNPIPVLVCISRMVGNLVQIAIGTVGLQRCCGEKLRRMDPESVLTFRTFFLFIFAVFIAPLCGSILFVLLAYDFLQKKAFNSISPMSLVLTWSFASSTGTLAILWVGVVLLATTRSFMLKYFGHSGNKKVHMRSVCTRVLDMIDATKSKSNSRMFVWKGLMLIALSTVSYLSIFFMQLDTCRINAQMCLLFAPAATLVAWLYPPAVCAFFQLYIMTSISALLLAVEGRCHFQYYYINSLQIFMVQLAIILTSYFITICVYKSSIILDELSKEHDKHCAVLSDAQKMRNEAKLVALISHEIKTPLNVIQGFSKEIEEYHPVVPSEAKFFAKQISEASSHILDILSELLELFRLNSGQYWVIRHSPMDLHAFWGTTCQKIVSLGDQYGVHVEYTIAQEVPNWITSDQCRLTQVLLNLASNAVQYTASRGKPVLEDKQNGEGEADYCDSSPHTKKNVDLELKYLDHCKSINIRIRDTGEGISTQLQKRLIEIFNGAHEDLNGNDYGISPGRIGGLSIAPEIVRKMGGTIDVSSALGHGTEFNVIVPVTRCNSQKRETSSNFVLSMISADVTIMIVEDSAVNQRLLERMLGRMGYSSIFKASNGLEALEVVKHSGEHFDVILLDLSMPQMDGIEFLTFLMVHGRPPSLINTSIIITSGHVSDDTWGELERLGTDGRVDKPYKQEQVAAAIEKAVRKSHHHILSTEECCPTC